MAIVSLIGVTWHIHQTLLPKANPEAINYLCLEKNSLIAEVIRPSNVADSENDYGPNVFDDAEERAPKLCHPPTAYWFVTYYREGWGNFINAAKYLEREIGVLPINNIKKYGKGVLNRAKVLTQAMMLFHLPCPSDGVFESTKPHRTSIYCKGRIYNQDLYELSEDDILQLCPDNVHLPIYPVWPNLTQEPLMGVPCQMLY